MIWFMSVCTSATFSIAMVFPLTFVTYLLTADWDKPRIFAACSSFIPCFSTMVLAKRALIAGRTVLTPTSHGWNIYSPFLLLFLENVYKYDACHIFMTRVMTELSFKIDHFTPNLSLLFRQGTCQKRRNWSA